MKATQFKTKLNIVNKQWQDKAAFFACQTRFAKKGNLYSHLDDHRVSGRSAGALTAAAGDQQVTSPRPAGERFPLIMFG